MHIDIPTTIPERSAFPCDKIHIKHSLQELGSYKLTLTGKNKPPRLVVFKRDNFSLYDSNSLQYNRFLWYIAFRKAELLLPIVTNQLMHNSIKSSPHRFAHHSQLYQNST